MARSVPRPRKISDFKPLFTNVAQTSHYLVRFGIPWPVQQHLISRGVDKRFIGEDIGLMASDAVIPGSSLMTADISGYLLMNHVISIQLEILHLMTLQGTVKWT